MVDVTFSVAVGGSGITYTDGTGTYGMSGYGYRTNLLPMLQDALNVATNTVTNATAAAASASSALNAPGTSATSVTSIAIATGAKSFTLAQTGKQYALGQSVVVASTASPGNQMNGIITAFISATGSMTVEVSAIVGSGTFTSWTIALASLASSTLPSMTGQSGLYLTNNGTVSSWASALNAAGNLAGLANYTTARANMGLGSLAVLSAVNNAHWSGTALSIANGGTGAVTAGAALTALGGATSGANANITSLSGLTTALSLTQGGTGATTASGGRTAFGLGTMATQNANAVAITGGTVAGLSSPLAVASGGTGVSTLVGFLSAIGGAASGANSDITALTGLTTMLSTTKGGTGQNFADLAALLAGLPITGAAAGEFRLGSLYFKYGQASFTAKTSGSTGEATVTFTTAFPTGVAGVYLQQVQTGGAEGGTVFVPYVKSYAAASFIGGIDSAGSPDSVLSTFWFAFGY